MAACAMLGAAPAMAQVEPVSATAAPPAPVVDYWIGDLAFTGQFNKDASLSLNGGNLNFSFGGGGEPVSGSARFKVWVPEDGVIRLQIDSCVTALRPVRAGGDIATGGAFTPDYAYTNTPVNCGLRPGEVITKRSDVMTPTADGIRYSYSAENRMANPKGKATLKGEALLRPVYKPIPKPAAPPPPPRVMAMTGAVPGATVPEGQMTMADGIRAYGIERVIDATLQLDSRMWLINRYDQGSVTNAKFLTETPGHLSDQLYGEYEFNGSRRGWIKLQLANGDLSCMEFWDQAGRCRPPGSFSIGTQFMVSAFAQGIFGGGGSSGGSSYASRQDDYDGCEGGACDAPRSPPPDYAPPPPPINSFYGDCHNPTGC